MANPVLKLLNYVLARLDHRVIYNEHGSPYLARGFIHGWRPPVKCPACEGQGYDFDGSLTLVKMDTHPDHPRARSCGHCDGKGVLHYVKKNRFNLYLHRFLRGDSDDAPHSHPWPWSVSLVLWGGYTEERLIEVNGIKYMKTRRVWPLTLNVFRDGDYHRVVRLHGSQTWTLFLTGPKSSSWGFWVFGRGHVEWRQRLKERGVKFTSEV